MSMMGREFDADYSSATPPHLWCSFSVLLEVLSFLKFCKLHYVCSKSSSEFEVFAHSDENFWQESYSVLKNAMQASPPTLTVQIIKLQNCHN
jgi:hypothetical protein